MAIRLWLTNGSPVAPQRLPESLPQVGWELILRGSLELVSTRQPPDFAIRSEPLKNPVSIRPRPTDFSTCLEQTKNPPHLPKPGNALVHKGPKCLPLRSLASRLLLSSPQCVDEHLAPVSDLRWEDPNTVENIAPLLYYSCTLRSGALVR
jgi:hypothetical protein